MSRFGSTEHYYQNVELFLGPGKSAAGIGKPKHRGIGVAKIWESGTRVNAHGGPPPKVSPMLSLFCRVANEHTLKTIFPLCRIVLGGALPLDVSEEEASDTLQP